MQMSCVIGLGKMQDQDLCFMFELVLKAEEKENMDRRR